LLLVLLRLPVFGILRQSSKLLVQLLEKNQLSVQSYASRDSQNAKTAKLWKKQQNK
jgi:hypothetical protein